MKIIQEYKPINEQEVIDKKAILQFLSRNSDAFLRDNLVAHFTSSAIVLDKTFTKVLFIHHNLYNSWGWVGGHNDGDKDFLHVAIKEAKEETGVVNIVPFIDEPIGIDSIYVPNHIKKGKWVPDHLHMNLTFLLIADTSDTLHIKEDENSGVKWFEIEEALSIITEPRMLPIYKKLFNKAKNIKKD